MKVPFSKRFRINRRTSEKGWFLQILAGFPVLVIYWNYEEFYRRTTGLGVGWLPPDLEEGGVMPFRRWVRGSY